MLGPSLRTGLGLVLAVGLWVPGGARGQVEAELDPVNEALFQRAVALGASDRDQAEQLLRTVLEALQKQVPPPRLQQARVMEQLAGVYLGKQDFFSSLDVAEWLYEYAREAFGPESSERVFRGFLLGRTYLKNDRFEDAEAILAHILPLIDKSPDLGSRFHGLVLSVLAQVRLRQGRPSEAEALAYRSVDLVLERNAAPPADSFLLVGRVQLRQGRLPEAEKAVRRALVVQEHMGSSGGARSTAEALVLLGFIQEARGEAAAANILFRHAHRVGGRNSPTDRIRLAPVERHAALEEARAAGAGASVAPLVPASSAAEAGALEETGNLLRDIGRPDLAADSFRAALEGLGRSPAKHRLGNIRLKASLAAVLAETGQAEAAEKVLREAIAHCEHDLARFEGFKKTLMGRLAELGKGGASGP